MCTFLFSEFAADCLTNNNCVSDIRPSPLSINILLIFKGSLGIKQSHIQYI